MRSLISGAIWAVLLLLITSCRSPGNLTGQSASAADRFADRNPFHIEPMSVSDSSIRSIQLHPTGNSNQAPILELNSGQTLTLQFERVSPESMQYRMVIEHFGPDWNSSDMSPNMYLDGFPELIIGSGLTSRNTRTPYRQYSVEFPQSNFQILRSGNYLLRVLEDPTGLEIFSLPFFVSENVGSIQAEVETRSTVSRRLQTVHRPAGNYILPDIVDQPQFDLSFTFTQNRFWGRHLAAEELDFSSPGEVRFELLNEQSFPGNSDYRRLELRDLTRQQRGIAEVFPAENPPKVILQDDVAEVNNSPFKSSFFAGSYGRPDMELNAEYANVVFPFDAVTSPDSTEAIHLLGDFNLWIPSANNRLTWDTQTGRWIAEVLIKEGVYRYKYVLIEDGLIDDLFFDNFFSNRTQQYHAFVYMYDPREFYYRLLKVHEFYSQ